ncbi:MAG: SRPBCC family protein [Thermomicrobiales bacterium]|nr:SRPBCC family protein [Thermomicrobiales bacterium]
MIETNDARANQVSRRAVINAPANEIFDLIANPHRHHELDGSGTVGENISGPQRVQLGDSFSTHMKQFGMKYRTTSTITLFEENRLIEWQVGKVARWRYELRAIDASTTEVTETWDVRHVPFAKMLYLTGMAGRNTKGIEATLRRLQERFGS